MNILSWNVNGIRAVIKKGFHEFLKKEKPDVICLQEIKISDTAREKEKEKLGIDFPDYIEFWNSAVRPGYSGTAVLVKSGTTAKAVKQLDKLPWDDEGRVQVIDLGKFYLANIYFPNANHELSRLNFKLNFNNKLLRYFKKLEVKKPLVITGDYNVAHEEIDLARPKDNVGNPGFTNEERAWMTKFLKAGFVDTFRYVNGSKIQYTWWSYRAGARVRNIGWRIDYFCVSEKIIKNIENAFILDKIQGSDHCPIGIKI